MRDATEAEKLIENFRGTAIGKFNCKYRRIKSAMLTVGQMFGQDEVLKKTKRKSMAVCTSDKLTVFILEKQVPQYKYDLSRDFSLTVQEEKQLKKLLLSQIKKLTGGLMEKKL